MPTAHERSSIGQRNPSESTFVDEVVSREKVHNYYSPYISVARVFSSFAAAARSLGIYCRPSPLPPIVRSLSRTCYRAPPDDSRFRQGSGRGAESVASMLGSASAAAGEVPAAADSRTATAAGSPATARVVVVRFPSPLYRLSLLVVVVDPAAQDGGRDGARNELPLQQEYNVAPGSSHTRTTTTDTTEAVAQYTALPDRISFLGITGRCPASQNARHERRHPSKEPSQPICPPCRDPAAHTEALH